MQKLRRQVLKTSDSFVLHIYCVYIYICMFIYICTHMRACADLSYKPLLSACVQFAARLLIHGCWWIQRWEGPMVTFTRRGRRTKSPLAPSLSPHSPLLTPDISTHFIFILAIVRISSKELHLLCTRGCPLSFNVREKMPPTTHCMSVWHESGSVGGLTFPILFLCGNGCCLLVLSNLYRLSVMGNICFIH